MYETQRDVVNLECYLLSTGHYKIHVVLVTHSIKEHPYAAIGLIMSLKLSPLLLLALPILVLAQIPCSTEETHYMYVSRKIIHSCLGTRLI